MKPPPQQQAETKPTILGPTSSNHLPAYAAANPNETIATEKSKQPDPNSSHHLMKLQRQEFLPTQG